MKIDRFQIIPHDLHFKFDAGTSRGVMKKHSVYYLKIFSSDKSGIGEIAPLPNLSIDFGTDFLAILENIFAQKDFQSFEEIVNFAHQFAENYPALAFGLETALLDLFNGSKKEIYLPNSFVQSSSSIPINGLVWMNTKDNMLEQIEDKIKQNFRCIKLKIGAIKWQEELDLLTFIRSNFSDKQLTIRVDANGGFDFKTAQKVLDELEKLQVHSIEQPIGVKNWQEMALLSSHNSVGVALDEELIGVHSKEEKINLLANINPPFLILKPTLLGGYVSCKEWIDLCQKNSINYWFTSALESNIGLNAVCQMTSFFESLGFQGLGTGQLYHNNIDSPLVVENGFIFYDKNRAWQAL
jgi:o-succinylbenzoate synthase